MGFLVHMWLKISTVYCTRETKKSNQHQPNKIKHYLEGSGIPYSYFILHHEKSSAEFDTQLWFFLLLGITIPWTRDPGIPPFFSPNPESRDPEKKILQFRIPGLPHKSRDFSFGIAFVWNFQKKCEISIRNWIFNEKFCY